MNQEFEKTTSTQKNEYLQGYQKEIAECAHFIALSAKYITETHSLDTSNKAYVYQFIYNVEYAKSKFYANQDVTRVIDELDKWVTVYQTETGISDQVLKDIKTKANMDSLTGNYNPPDIEPIQDVKD